MTAFDGFRAGGGLIVPGFDAYDKGAHLTRSVCLVCVCVFVFVVVATVAALR